MTNKPTKVLAIVTLKPYVRDTHGEGVMSSLKLMGFDNVNKLRYGKQFVISLDEQDQDKAKTMVEQMCLKLLSNQLIEEYEVRVL
jgi:phosphoribosylformylglycinamidine synthase PurS subunit